MAGNQLVARQITEHSRRGAAPWEQMRDEDAREEGERNNARQATQWQRLQFLVEQTCFLDQLSQWFSWRKETPQGIQILQSTDPYPWHRTMSTSSCYILHVPRSSPIWQVIPWWLNLTLWLNNNAQNQFISNLSHNTALRKATWGNYAWSIENPNKHIHEKV